MVKILNWLSHLDHKISKPLHSLDHWIPTALLYLSTSFFHPRLFWIAIVAIYWLGDTWTASVYGAGMLLCLGCTFILKKITKRSRPILN